MSQERVLKAFKDLAEAKVIATDRYISECQSCRASLLKEIKAEQSNGFMSDKYTFCLNDNRPLCENCSSDYKDDCVYSKFLEFWKDKGVE